MRLRNLFLHLNMHVTHLHLQTLVDKFLIIRTIWLYRAIEHVSGKYIAVMRACRSVSDKEHYWFVCHEDAPWYLELSACFSVQVIRQNDEMSPRELLKSVPEAGFNYQSWVNREVIDYRRIQWTRGIISDGAWLVLMSKCCAVTSHYHMIRWRQACLTRAVVDPGNKCFCLLKHAGKLLCESDVLPQSVMI